MSKTAFIAFLGVVARRLIQSPLQYCRPLIYYSMETQKLQLLARAMQTYTWRMQAITSNIANLDTPGYQRLSVSFEDELQNARSSLQSSEILSSVRPSLNVEENAPVIEDELMDMADTQMRTQLTTRALREHFETMRMGITGHSG